MPDLFKSIPYSPLIAGCLVLAVFDAGAAAVTVKTTSYAELAYYPEHATAAEVIARYDSKVSAEITATVTAIDHDTGKGTEKNGRPVLNQAHQDQIG